MAGELKVAEEEIDVKEEGRVEERVMVEGGVVVKGEVKAAARATMTMGKATQE